jgi:hypothetical protein
LSFKADISACISNRRIDVKAGVARCYFTYLGLFFIAYFATFNCSPEMKLLAGAILPYDAFVGIAKIAISLDRKQEVVRKNTEINEPFLGYANFDAFIYIKPMPYF